MDHLPNNPSNPNSNNNSTPNYLKHTHYSEVAQNKPRDEHGHFIHTDHPETLTSPTNPNLPISLEHTQTETPPEM